MQINLIRENRSTRFAGQHAEDFKRHGMQQPISVVRNGDVFAISDGLKRFRAAELLGWTEIEAQVEERDLRGMEPLRSMILTQEGVVRFMSDWPETNILRFAHECGKTVEEFLALISGLGYNPCRDRRKRKEDIRDAWSKIEKQQAAYGRRSAVIPTYQEQAFGPTAEVKVMYPTDEQIHALDLAARLGKTVEWLRPHLPPTPTPTPTPPAICTCPWDLVRAQGCQCGGK